MSLKKAKRQLIHDIFLIAISIIVAIFVVESGLAHELVLSLDGFSLIGVFVAGMFFTSVFTTPPAIAVLGTLAETTTLPLLVLFGALGAVLGDSIIFMFVKDRVAEDIKFLTTFTRRKRFFAIFRTRLFKFFVPFIGALIIASPFPDELGISMLGLSKVKGWSFFLISFTMNGLGILVIGWLAKSIVGL